MRIIYSTVFLRETGKIMGGQGKRKWEKFVMKKPNVRRRNKGNNSDTVPASAQYAGER